MLKEHRFDVSGIDVVATGDDHVLLAVGDVEIALLVHIANVARVEPAGLAVGVGAQGVGRLGGQVPIALHDLGAVHDDLADLADGQFLLAGLQVDDLEIGVGQGHADRVGLGPVYGVHGDTGAGLGQAVGLQHLASGDGLELILDLGRQGGRRTHGEAQGGEVVPISPREIEKADEHGRHAAVIGGLVGLDRFQHVDHVTGVGDLDHGLGIGHGDVEADRQAIAVKVGHDSQHDILGLPALGPYLEHGGVGDQVIVAQLGAFGAAGGAAGVDEGRDLVGVDLDGRRPGCAGHHVLEPVGVRVAGNVHLVALLFLLGQGKEELEDRRKVLFDVGNDDALQAGVGPDALDPLIELAHDDKGGGSRVVDQVLDLAAHIERIAADHDAADAPDGKSGDGELGAVG